MASPSAPDHRRGQEGRRAAAKMHLADPAGRVHQRLQQRQFLFEIVKILAGRRRAGG